MTPQIGIGRVIHARLRPVVNRFSYPTYFLLLPMRSLRREPCAALHRNGFGLISFHDRDHGDGRADSLAWLEEVLTTEGVRDADGEVWLHCYPRVLGHTFKPVSFWYCHRADDSLAAVIVEVNNTFGERHCYVLQGPEVAFGRELTARKVFHVSPFCDVSGSYRFRFLRTDVGRLSWNAHPNGDRPRTERACTIARIDHDDPDGPLIRTSVSGQLSPLTPRSARSAFFGMPLMTLGVVARIHWQALKLWTRRVPFFRKPAAPSVFLSR